jgi:predicted ATPase
LALMSARGTELLERSTELEAIAAALERAEGGAGSVVLIEGEAGIGKTELLCAARGLGTDAGVAVLTARASELERDYSYGLVRQLFQAPLIELDPDERAQALSGAAALAGAMLDVAGAAADESAQDGFARLHGLHWLCANLAETQPLMLAVDDIQWSDTESLRFLHYLAGRLSSSRPSAPGSRTRRRRSSRSCAQKRWLAESGRRLSPSTPPSPSFVSTSAPMPSRASALLAATRPGAIRCSSPSSPAR